VAGNQEKFKVSLGIALAAGTLALAHNNNTDHIAAPSKQETVPTAHMAMVGRIALSNSSDQSHLLITEPALSASKQHKHNRHRHHSSPNLSTTNGRAKYIFNYLTHNGVSQIGAAGLIGGFWVEDTYYNPNQSGGYLGQWQGGRLVALQNFATSKNEPVTYLPAQVGYVVQELKNGPYAGENDSNVLNMLNAASTPTSAASIATTYYERPNPSFANETGRENMAMTVYAELAHKQ
jgi:Phage tail lysozyme